MSGEISAPEDTRPIPLSQGKVAIVDAADFEWLNQWKWSLLNGKYAARQTGPKGQRVSILMHRLIMDTPAGMDTDHINGNKLDNRRCNLRVATRGQNNVNRGLTPNNTTGFKGVHSPKHSPRVGTYWEAVLIVNNKNVPLGAFGSPEEAGRAFDIAALEHFGEFAQLNFPDRLGDPAPVPLDRSNPAWVPSAGTQARRLYDFVLAHPSGKFTLGELSRACVVVYGNVSPLMARLVKHGYAEIDRNTQPHRYSSVPARTGESK